jgi:hypothetical protein
MKKDSLIYEYEIDDDENEGIAFLKNCYLFNKKKFLFHADFYDIFKGIDNDNDEFSIVRIGINKKVKLVKPKGKHGR